MGRELVRCDDCGDEKFLMDIDTTTNGINNFQATASSVKIGEEKAVTELPHIQQALKQ